MKDFYITLTFLFMFNLCLGQETVKKSRLLGPGIKEQFYVLKSDKNVKNGAYEAAMKNQNIALGNYLDNKRIGHWTFFNDQGKLIQHYNYSTKKLLYNDTSDIKNLGYTLTDSLKDGDIITYPIKIGGYHYGLQPLTNAYKDFVKNAHLYFHQPDHLDIEDIFTISADGKMIKHEVSFLYNESIKTYTVKNNRLNEYNTDFIPGSLNGIPKTFQLIVSGMKMFFTTR